MLPPKAFPIIRKSLFLAVCVLQKLLGLFREGKQMRLKRIDLWGSVSIAAIALWLSSPLVAVEITGKVLASDPAGRWLTLERSSGGLKRPVTFEVQKGLQIDDSVVNGSIVTVTFDPEAEMITDLRFNQHNQGGPRQTNQPPGDAKKFEGHYYKIFLEPITWAAAEQRCRAMGGHLAILNTPSKARFIVQLARQMDLPRNPMDGIWIGATDREREGRWLWVDGSDVTFTDWLPNQPNNKNDSEHYAMIFLKQGKWCDQPVASTQHTTYFVCEWADTVPDPIGVFRVSWTGPFGNKGDLQYEFLENHRFLRAGRSMGSWTIVDRVVQLNFDDPDRGTAAIKFISPQSFEGIHRKGNGQESKWIGTRSE